jgi:hypothetical protein
LVQDGDRVSFVLSHRYARIVARYGAAPALVTLLACSGLEPGPEAVPETGPEDTSHPQRSMPRWPEGSGACVREAPPADASWELHTGPSEQTTRQVAATSNASFVMSTRSLKRAWHGASSFESLSHAPGEIFLHIAASASRLVLVSDAGVFTSDDDGVTFEATGLDGVVTEIRASSEAILVTDAAGGLARWDEASGAWLSVDTAGTPMLLGASDGSTVLGDTGAGVLRSQAAGTWVEVAGLEAWGYRDLVVSGEKSVAITLFGELRASHDAGASFSPSSAEAFGPATRVAATGADAFVATTTSGVIRSTDGGASWSMVAPSQIFDGGSSIAAQGSAVVVASPSVRTSQDGGASFSPPLAVRDATIVSMATIGPWTFVSTADRRTHVSAGAYWQGVEPVGYVVGGSARDGEDEYLHLSFRLPGERGAGSDLLVHTNDEGESFTQVELPPYAEHAALASFEATRGALFFGSLGDQDLGGNYAETPYGRGIYRSDDGGDTWRKTSDGLPHVELPEGGTARPGVLALEARHGVIVALLAGEPPHVSGDLGEAWSSLAAGLDANASLDRVRSTDTGFVAASSIEAEQLYVLREGETAWQALAATGLPAGFRVASIEATGGLLFVGLSGNDAPGVYVSSDGGATFVRLAVDGQAITLHASGDDVFAGSRGNGLASIRLAPCE